MIVSAANSGNKTSFAGDFSRDSVTPTSKPARPLTQTDQSSNLNTSPSQRAMTDVVLSAGFAVIFVLYLLMFVALYRWSGNAPVFPPDRAAGPPTGEAIPWSQ
jgi:hypothetical protein